MLINLLIYTVETNIKERTYQDPLKRHKVIFM
jgi:hypothetical protein